MNTKIILWIKSNELDDWHYSMSQWHSIALDTSRLYHTGKLWKKHSAITFKWKIIDKNNNSCFKVPGKKDLENLIPPPWKLPPLLLPYEFLMPSVGGSISHLLVWKVTVSIFLMNLCRYTCNSSWSLCKVFLKLFKHVSLLLLNVHVFSADTKHKRYFKITSVNW